MSESATAFNVLAGGARTHADEAPESIGRYPVIREIGRGTTSIVYLARDPFGDRDVAIKVVRFDRFADADEAKRFRKAFLNEASLAGTLNHPHVAAIYDAGSFEACSYLVMEYVPGGTLQAYCSPATLLPVARVAEIVFKASLALRFARNHGIIHRDIKPANILVTATGDIKISDFGSAQLEGRDSTQLTGVGSPAYMSPEQILEKPLSQQTDIYSLGVVMYQLLTGRIPFRGSTRAALVYEILTIDPPPPSALRVDLPPALDAVVMRALKKDLGERFGTWEEFSRELPVAFGSMPAAGTVPGDAERFNLIRKLSFFRDFTEIEAWETLRVTNWRRVPACTVLIREGERGDAFYVLVEGGVEVSRAGHALETLEPGACFGEIVYFAEPDAVRTTTITTLSPIVAIEIKSSSLRLATDRLQVQFNKAFMRILVEKLARANRVIAGG